MIAYSLKSKCIYIYVMLFLMHDQLQVSSKWKLPWGIDEWIILLLALFFSNEQEMVTKEQGSSLSVRAILLTLRVRAILLTLFGGLWFVYYDCSLPIAILSVFPPSVTTMLGAIPLSVSHANKWREDLAKCYTRTRPARSTYFLWAFAVIWKAEKFFSTPFFSRRKILFITF